jgi:hypothetical protein
MSLYEYSLNPESPNYNITLSRVGAQGATGATGASGVSGLSWIDYVTGYAADPTLTQTIASGDVYTYTYSNGTLYRLVPSGAASDSFYTTFTDGTLSDLVSSKEVNI